MDDNTAFRSFKMRANKRKRSQQDQFRKKGPMTHLNIRPPARKLHRPRKRTVAEHGRRRQKASDHPSKHVQTKKSPPPF
ncbi:uncharacterized protein SCHCODRAFT_02633733 [Schizophyllum commune H4-8]|uniref:uncharacterized protein n=1 Tax=Schizophyllum commune (strain H4-8 / FGSC 9210) TaxID=578458 RepID=UPI0021603094|nr:uncharacterized protein SCHCODRAFT_02633733 [Schizophyllum commune H4-8]KAI5889171.1 hypothetical protein SCHCODRAFT_02633733 [Schizophyllum commune H4-8]